MKSVLEQSILAVRIGKYEPLREPIRMLLFTMGQFSHIIIKLTHLTRDNKLRQFCFRLLHGITATRGNLNVLILPLMTNALFVPTLIQLNMPLSTVPSLLAFIHKLSCGLIIVMALPLLFHQNRSRSIPYLPFSRRLDLLITMVKDTFMLVNVPKKNLV